MPTVLATFFAASQVMNLREWELSTPQFESFIHSFAATNDRLQQLHFAIVANPSALKELQVNQILEDISEAESWLGTFGCIRCPSV